MFTQITLGNILSYHTLFLQILFLDPVYSLKYHSLAQIIDENIPTQFSIFFLHLNYARENSVLPHNLPANIIRWPSLFLRIFFLSPDYQQQYSFLAENILCSPRLH